MPRAADAGSAMAPEPSALPTGQGCGAHGESDVGDSEAMPSRQRLRRPCRARCRRLRFDAAAFAAPTISLFLGGRPWPCANA